MNQHKNYRNKYVHAGEESSVVELYLFQLKQVVEDLLMFYINNHFNFNSFREMGDFLNQPHKIEDLRYRADLAKNALHYLYKEN